MPSVQALTRVFLDVHKPHTDTSKSIQVYKACTDWVRWDMEGRAQYLHALLNAVHIYALPPKFLKNQLLSCPILSKVNDSLASCCLIVFLNGQMRVVLTKVS